MSEDAVEKGKIVLRKRGNKLYRYRKYYDHARKQWRYAYVSKVDDSSNSLPSEGMVKSGPSDFAFKSSRRSLRLLPHLRSLQHSKTLRNIRSRPALLSLIVTAVMVLSLIYVPTAGAVSVQATLQPGQNLVQGDQPLVFNVIITVDSGERLPVERLDIVLDTLTYQFNPDGSPLSVPNSVVTVLNLTPPASALFNPLTGYGYGFGPLSGFGYGPSSGYGYSASGFGYGYGSATAGYGVGPTTFIYQVRIDQNQLAVGQHTLRVDIVTGLFPQSIFSSNIITFFVVQPGQQTGGGADFLVSLNPTVLNIQIPTPGNGTSQVTITSVGTPAFEGNVTAKFFAPPDITATLGGTTINSTTGKNITLSAGGSVTQALVLTAVSTAPPGQFYVTLSVEFGTPGQSGFIGKPINFQVNVFPSGQAVVAASPSVVSTGGTIVFTGAGFQAGDTITLTAQFPPPIGTQDMTPTPAPVADGAGLWTATLTIPTDIPVFGTFPVTATGSPSTRVATTSVTIVVGTAPDFTLVASPDTVSVVPPPPGQPANQAPPVNLNIQSINDFTGTVTFTAVGLPSGVT
ncbi:MAG: hypothetical protein ACE5PO_06075, partial [Candidatus Bathyarchaeia archaeon]